MAKILNLKNTKVTPALAASEVRYRRLFETAQDAILILDGDSGKIMDANPFVGGLTKWHARASSLRSPIIHCRAVVPLLGIRTASLSDTSSGKAVTEDVKSIPPTRRSSALPIDCPRLANRVRLKRPGGDS
jgi:PAS domain-containing protein